MARGSRGVEAQPSKSPHPRESDRITGPTAAIERIIARAAEGNARRVTHRKREARLATSSFLAPMDVYSDPSWNAIKLAMQS
jgi:hypothetical protein